MSNTIWPEGYTGFRPGVFPYRENNLYTNDGYTHLLLLEGEMELPYPASRDQCFHVADQIAEACGYLANCIGQTGLLITGNMRQYFMVWSGPYVTSTLKHIYVKDDEIEQQMLLVQLTDIIDRIMYLRERNTHRPATYAKMEDAWYDLLAARRIVQENSEAKLDEEH